MCLSRQEVSLFSSKRFFPYCAGITQEDVWLGTHDLSRVAGVDMARVWVCTGPGQGLDLLTQGSVLAQISLLIHNLF